jgi:hypothetical protein
MDAGALLARVGPGLFQQAFVVHDLEAAAYALSTTTGCSDFVTLPATMLPYRYRGETVECALELGFARSGNVQIELLQPVEGDGIHVEFLRDHGPGAHHLGFMVDDLDAELAAAAADGFDEVMSGAFGSLRFAYVDTFAELGLYTELVQDPDGMMAQLKPWRDPA